MIEFKAYLEKVDITTEALLSRIQLIYDVASEMCPERIEQIFVTDYIKKDNTRAYESIWFFSKGYCMEAKDFETDYSIDIIPIKIYRFEIALKDYDFKKATPKSRLQLSIQFDEQLSGDLKGAKENCDVLRDIILKYLKPNLAT